MSCSGNDPEGGGPDPAVGADAEDHRLVAATWTEALEEVEEELAALAGAPDRFLVLNVDRCDDVFVQFAHRPSGWLSAEASASKRCGVLCEQRHVLPLHQQALLVALGWRPPDLEVLELASGTDGHPNFYKHMHLAEGCLPPLFADLAVRTLHDVWHVEPGDVRVRWGRFPADGSPDRI